MPCMKHEKVSNKLADFRGSIPKRLAMSLVMGPDMMRAIVLFAVHKSAKLTRAAILNSAPFLDLT